MSIDIFHSRRTNFRKCYFYKRDKSVSDLAKFVLEAQPAGFFYARMFTPNTRQNQDIANAFRFSENMLNIVTEDEVDDLVENCIVLFNGKPYVVVNVQRKEHLKESQFSDKSHYTTYISLRK